MNNRITMKVDYLAVVFEQASARQIIKALLRLPEEQFQVQAGYVRYKSYTAVYTMGNIKVYSDCMQTDQNPYGLGSYLMLSGKGCSQLQIYLEASQRNFASFFADCFRLYKQTFHVTRIDLAIDDQNEIPYFTMEQIKEKCIRREFQSRSRNFRFQESSFYDGSTALTVYIGDRKSNILYRFYDKDKEQAGKQHLPIAQIGTWKRTEMELKDQAAHAFVKEAGKQEKSIESLTTGFLGANLRFLEPDDNQCNKSRWKTSPFWNTFLGDIKPFKLSIHAEYNTLYETQVWLRDGGVLSAVKAFELLESYHALGNLADMQSLKANAKFSPALSEKIVTHLTMQGREDLIPCIYRYTKI